MSVFDDSWFCNVLPRSCAERAAMLGTPARLARVRGSSDGLRGFVKTAARSQSAIHRHRRGCRDGAWFESIDARSRYRLRPLTREPEEPGLCAWGLGSLLARS